MVAVAFIKDIGPPLFCRSLNQWKDISPQSEEPARCRRWNGHGDLAGVGDGRLRDGGPGIRQREVGGFLKLEVQSRGDPRDDNRCIRSRDVQ